MRIACVRETYEGATIYPKLSCRHPPFHPPAKKTTPSTHTVTHPCFDLFISRTLSAAAHYFPGVGQRVGRGKTPAAFSGVGPLGQALRLSLKKKTFAGNGLRSMGNH